MCILPNDYGERVYAGWLGKCIGVHFGGPLEGWSYQKIYNHLGEIQTFLQEPGKIFKPDDDLILPLIMMTVLSETDNPSELTASKIGNSWRNLLSKERGGIWRGGYGISSEHTALINLHNGLEAPFSGSAKLNGLSLSEQIGGQIFSDIWGLVLPNNPMAAADLAEKASSISHDGEGINGGRYIAALVSNAFSGLMVKENVKKGLDVLPSICVYKKMVLDLLSFHKSNPIDWRKARDYVEENWSYKFFSGEVPIIPNGAVIVLSLLYGENDFSKSIQIANMCGWDTDCNVGNVGAVLGTTVSITGIPERWRMPLNDFIVSSSVQGTNNILDFSNTANYLINCGRKFAGIKILKELPRYHFDFPGSTQGFISIKNRCKMVKISQDCSQSYEGKGSLKVSIDRLHHKGEVDIYVRTHFMVNELNSNNYESCFTPKIFPGQKVTAKVMLDSLQTGVIKGSIYVSDREKGFRCQEPGVILELNKWIDIHLNIPRIDDICISEVGISFCTLDEQLINSILYIDSINWKGNLNFKSHLGELKSNGKTVTGWTTYSGYWRVEEGAYICSGVDYNESYTCDPEMCDYEMEVSLEPIVGYIHNLNFRVQGGLKSYTFGFVGDNKIGLMKKINGIYKVILTKSYLWEHGKRYNIKIITKENEFKLFIDGENLINYIDSDYPYKKGQIGLSNGPNCSTKFYLLDIKPYHNNE